MTPHDDVLAAARGLVPARLATGTAGNVSVRLDDGHLLVTPSGVPYDVMTAADLVVLDLDGAVVEGHRPPSSEWALHAECYRRFPEVRAVLHTHPPFATAFAAARRAVPPVVDELVLYAGGGIPCAVYAPSGTVELARNAADLLAGVGTVLLASHGMVTVAPDAAEALRQASTVEHAALAALGAALLGGAAELPAEALAGFAARYRSLRGR